MKYIVITLILMFGEGLIAQSAVFKEEKEFTLSKVIEAGQDFNINVVRSDIKIRIAESNEIKAKVKIISKHINQKQAHSDLEKMIVTLSGRGSDMVLSNSVRVKKASDKPKSNLRVEMIIHVPKQIILNINNRFGDIDIEGAFDALKINSAYGPVKFRDVSGSTELKSNYGNIFLDNVKGSVTIDADRSDMVLEKIDGIVNVRLTYGKLVMVVNENQPAYSIQAKYAPLVLSYNFEIHTDLKIECKECGIITDVLKVDQVDQMSKVDLDLKNAVSQSIIQSELEEVTVKVNQK